MNNNVLIPNVGRRGYLVRYLKQIPGFVGKVYVSDCDPTASGLYGCSDGAYILPRPKDNEDIYIRKLLELCSTLKINVVIPVIDPEIYILSKYRDVFRKIGIFLSVSSRTVLDICYNKEKMNKFLKENGFRFPKTFHSIEDFETGIQEHETIFPVIIKPIYGSGSESTYKASDITQTKSLFREGMIIQEFISGSEYGIDVFNDIFGQPIRCVVKKKLSMRGGETDKSVTIKDNRIQTLAIDLGGKLKHICNLDIDVLEYNGAIYVIDLNPRFGGGYPATHEAGVNLLEQLLLLANGVDIVCDFNNYETGMYVFKEVSITKTEHLIG